MVTNLLVFFVLLLSMSEVRQDDQFIEFMQAVREAFGYIGGTEQLPVDQQMETKNVDLAQMLVIPIRPENFSESPDPGVRNKHHAVTALRREQFASGGKWRFRELSADLSPDGVSLIAEYAEKLRGHRTQIEVRGHCNRRPVDGSNFADHYELSYARARHVADVLISNGIDPARIVVVAAGTNEPIATSAYTDAERRENDLVEILQINRRVDEYGGEPAPTDDPSSPLLP